MLLSFFSVDPFVYQKINVERTAQYKIEGLEFLSTEITN
jgi:hypothetical protein